MDSIELDLIKNLIKKQPAFSLFTSKECETLATLFSEQHFKTGDIIVTEGDPVDSIFLIAEGKAEVRQAYIKDRKIETKILTSIGPGESIGLNETGFYSISGRRTATVIALTDISAIKLGIAAFHGFALANSHVSEIMRKNAISLNGSDF